MKLARQIRYYGGVYFLPCLTNFPAPRTPVSIYALNKELIFCYPDLTERSFRVTRMRSWRITTIVQVKLLWFFMEIKYCFSCAVNFFTFINCFCLQEQNVDQPKLELSFEYLLSKDRLQWITVDSPQVIFLSLCLQSMVEELMRKQQDSSASSTSSFHQVNGN